MVRIRRALRIFAMGREIRPRWLSEEVRSLKEMRRARNNRPRGAATRFQEALHQLQTFRASATAALAICFGLVFIASTIGVVLKHFGSTTTPELASTLLTVAETLGGIAGILIAVVVFGVQFHGERMGEAAFLVRYLARREGLVPVTAVTLSVVSANLIVALIGTLWLPEAAKVLAILDLSLAPMVMGFTLWLFYRMVVSVSGDFFREGLLPGLTWEYSRLIDEEAFYASMAKRFEEVLEEHRCKYLAWYPYDLLNSKDEIGLGRLPEGRVLDIDIAGLGALLEDLRRDYPTARISLTVAPGDTSDRSAILWLGSEHPDFGAPPTPALAIPQSRRDEINRRLGRVYDIGRRRKTDLLEILGRFSSVLVSQARADRADQFRRGLDVLEELIRLRVLHSNGDALPTSGLHVLPDYLGDFEYRDMAKGVVESGDDAKIEALTEFAYRFARIAADARHPALFQRATGIVDLVYYFGSASQRVCDFVATHVDSTVESFRFLASHGLRDENEKTRAAMLPLQHGLVRWIVDLIKTALERGRKQDASDFLDRLEQLADRRGARRREDERSQLRDFVTYAEILIVGWCLKLMGDAEAPKNAASHLIQRLARIGVRQTDVFSAWESMPEAEEGGRVASARHWEFASRRIRRGISAGTSGGTIWPFNGLIAFLLINFKLPGAAHSAGLGGPPTSEPPGDDHVRAVAESVLARPIDAQEPPLVPDIDKQPAVESVRKLFASRRRLFKLAALKQIVEAPISDTRLQRLTVDLCAVIEQHRCPWIKNLSAKLPRGQMAGFVPWPAPQNWTYWQKDVFTERELIEEYWTSHNAKVLCDREDKRHVYLAETLVPSGDVIGDIHLLADKLKALVTQLRGQGANPTMIFLPRQERFSFELFRKPEWQVESRRNDEPGHLGQWEGCDVFEFPYMYCESVLVIDPLRFFGRNDIRPEEVAKIEITDRNERDHAEILRKALEGADDSMIPAPHQVTVVARTSIRPVIGVADVSAGFKLPLDLRHLGYALQRDENVYHRPSCDRLAGEVSKFSLSPHLEGDNQDRTPCLHCRPDDWDDAPSLDEEGITDADLHKPVP